MRFSTTVGFFLKLDMKSNPANKRNRIAPRSGDRSGADEANRPGDGSKESRERERDETGGKEKMMRNEIGCLEQMVPLLF